MRNKKINLHKSFLLPGNLALLQLSDEKVGFSISDASAANDYSSKQNNIGVFMSL